MHRYSPLLSGAAAGLDCASCLHVDDIGQSVDLDLLLEEAVVFFDRIGEKPKRVSYWFDCESNSRRSSLGRFIKNYQGSGHAVGTTIRSISISGHGFEGDAMSDTWTPRSVFSCSCHGRTIKAFFQSPVEFEKEKGVLSKLAFRLFENFFSSAHIFEYPFVFSPLAYTTGLIYSPNVRQWGGHTLRDKERVTNWSNHCYRGHRASEGYLRDVYPVNLISLEHTEMHVGSVKLGGWIGADPARGSLSRLNGKFLWEIGCKNIRSVQRELDKAEILLAGFPPE